MEINWSSLKDTINEDTLKNKFNSFVQGSTHDVQYLENSQPQLTPEEYKVLEKLNKKQNMLNTQSYKTTIFSLSFNDMLKQWSETMIFLLKDVLDMIYTKNVSMSNIFLILNAENRMFFTGLTLIIISLLIYLGDI